MAGLTLAAAFIHSGYKAKIGIHLSQSFKSSDIRHISQKGQGGQRSNPAYGDEQLHFICKRLAGKKYLFLEFFLLLLDLPQNLEIDLNALQAGRRQVKLIHHFFSFGVRAQQSLLAIIEAHAVIPKDRLNCILHEGDLSVQ